MPINYYKLRWWGAFLLVGLLPLIVFFSILIFKGFWLALVLSLLVLFLCIKLAFKIVWHPFLGYLFGEGLLVMTVDSTGIIIPALASMNPANAEIEFQVGDRKVRAKFNRDLVWYLTPIREGTFYDGELKVKIVDKKGKEKEGVFKGKFVIIPEKVWDYKYAMEMMPVLLFNRNLGTFITKDFFKEKEENIFKKMVALEILRLSEELSDQQKFFAKYIMEFSRPKKDLWAMIKANAGWIVFIIILIFGLVVGLPLIKGAISAGAEAMKAGGAIVPR